MIITDLFESYHTCPECGGPAFTDLILAEKKDACYYKVKASAKVWPSAYASGRLVQCRKKGADNYGKSKNEGVAEGLPQTLRKVVPGHAKREIDRKMDAGKFGKTDADKDANFQRYKKIQDKIKEQGVAEGTENYNGVNILFQKDDDEIFVKASAGGRELGHVLFVIDGDYLMPQDLEVEERYRGQGIAQTMYDFVKSKGYKIRRSGQQTDAGAGFWDKHKGQGQNVWEQGVAEEQLDEKCWDTHKQVGMKNKGGRQVPNCVPAESVNEMDKSQTPPGRDGSNDSDASKKEYTAKATTPEKVAKDAEKILNKELNKKQGVAEDQLDEKSTSQAQFRTMAAAAHNPEFAKKVGISRDVAKEFHGADRKQDYKDLPKKADESKSAPKEKEADYGDNYQDMVARVKKLAGLGPLKTVYDPARRVYRNVPTAVQPKK